MSEDFTPVRVYLATVRRLSQNPELLSAVDEVEVLIARMDPMNEAVPDPVSDAGTEAAPLFAVCDRCGRTVRIRDGKLSSHDVAPLQPKMCRGSRKSVPTERL